MEIPTSLKMDYETSTLKLPNSYPTATESTSKIPRKCAYCLKVCGFPPKLCSGCKKRAYCSKECQAADWSRKGEGQRHVNWCRRYEHGEEDVDWEVVSIPNKGLGIRVKRLLPEGYKIIVEPVFTDPHGHPGINDLEPKGGSLQDKFKLNELHNAWPCRDNGASYVGLRISRVNHNCRPNAARIYDEVARVEILYALQDIQPGEEICRSYYFFPTVFLLHCCPRVQSLEDKYESYWRGLNTIWGIKCPDDCACKDPKVRQLLAEGEDLNFRMESLAREGKTEEALAVGQKLRPIQKYLNLTWNELAKLDIFLFRLAIWRKKTFPKADRHMRFALEFFRSITPYSGNLEKMEWQLNHPTQHSQYLKADTYPDFIINELGEDLKVYRF